MITTHFLEHISREEPSAPASQYATDIARLRTLCERKRDDANDKLRSLPREFLLDWKVILRQVAKPHLPQINIATEKILRR